MSLHLIGVLFSLSFLGEADLAELKKAVNESPSINYPHCINIIALRLIVTCFINQQLTDQERTFLPSGSYIGCREALAENDFPDTSILYSPL